MLPINVLYKLQVIKLNYHVKLGTEGEGVCVLNPKTNRCLAIKHVKISDTRLGNRTEQPIRVTRFGSHCNSPTGASLSQRK